MHSFKLKEQPFSDLELILSIQKSAVIKLKNQTI